MITETRFPISDRLKAVLDAVADNSLFEAQRIIGTELRYRFKLPREDGTTHALAVLVPKYLRRVGAEPDEYYEMTLTGLLASSRREYVLSRVELIRAVLARLLTHDPRFRTFTWETLKEAPEPPLAASEIGPTYRLIEMLDLSGGTNDGPSQNVTWQRPSRLEDLLAFPSAEAYIEHVEYKRLPFPPRESLLAHVRAGNIDANSLDDPSLLELKNEIAHEAWAGRKNAEPTPEEQPNASDSARFEHSEPSPSHRDPEVLAALLEQVGGIVANCYMQATRDAVDDSRLSYVGPAAELREVLLGVLHHLAPDDAMTAAGLAIEPSQTRYTQRQRVEFILRQRGKRKIEEAEGAYQRVDSLARDIIARAQGSMHKGASNTQPDRRKDARECLTLLNYVTALLRDLLL